MHASPVEQVRAAVDIVRLVSQHVALKKSGRTFKGLCPFHSEKTPSFIVFPETGRWHCFGCGEGGDIFTFLMKIENQTFPEALRRLAEEAGVPITRFTESKPNKEGRERLYAANEAAALFFHGLLLNSTPAHAYVQRRGITDDTTRSFLLGLAPDSSDALQRHLGQAGFTVEEMLAAGLLYQGDDGPPRDRFRGRLMFPIREVHGKIVSFGGRALAVAQQPKYLNGPQTDIFDKGSTLYGFHAATQAIKREKRAVIVEGYVDVVIAHQEGFENVVATLGTSMTERHVQELRRLTPEICLALDGDKAGQAASQRGGAVGPQAVPGVQVAADRRAEEPRVILGPTGSAKPLLGFERISITVAVLPDGKDPDELILENPDLWREALQTARPVMAQAIAWAGKQYDVQTLEGKRDAAEALLPLLAELADPIARAHYLEMAAHELRLDARALAERITRLRRPPPRHQTRSAAAPTTPQASSPGSLAQAQVYAIALVLEAAQRGLPTPTFDPEQFSEPDLQALLANILELLGAAPASWRPEPLDEIHDPWLLAAVARVQAELPITKLLPEAEILSEASFMALELRQAHLAIEHSELQALTEEPTDESTPALLARIAANARARAEATATSRGRRLGTRAPTIPWRFLTPHEWDDSVAARSRSVHPEQVPGSSGSPGPATSNEEDDSG